jgi:hypothetical protein
MSHRLNQALCALFDLLFAPFREANPWIGFAVVCVATAALMLLAYRYTSNQPAIRITKDRIKAHLLEVRLFRDDPGTVLRAQGLLILYNLKYLGHSIIPLLVMIVPLSLLLIQLDLRFGHRPLAPGESALVVLRLNPGLKPTTQEISLDSPSGVSVDTPPLRIDSLSEVDWRIRGVEPGTHTLRVRIGQEVFEKRLEARSGGLPALSPARPGDGWMDQLLNPAEPPLPPGSAATSIEIRYPGREMSVFGVHLHWMVPFFVLSIFLGLSLKGLFRVEI